MSLYIRKVNKSKWNWEVPLPLDIHHGELGTDGITNCCKTQKNTLSIWMIDSRELSSDSDRKIIATLATNSTNLSFVDYVIISDDELRACGIQVANVDGRSIIPDIVSRHYDIVNLKIESLARLAKLINHKVSGVRSDEGVNIASELKRINVQRVKQCIADYIPEGSEMHQQLMLQGGFEKVYS